MTLAKLTLGRYWALSTVCLIAVTLPLWCNGAGDTRYPAIPFAVMGRLPADCAALVSNLFLAALLIQLTIAGVASKTPSRWWIGVFVCFVGLFALDQHRLQPWAYQSAIHALIFGCCDRRQTRRLLTLITASIYLYSSAGKFDFQFAHTVGPTLLRHLWSPVEFFIPFPGQAVVPLSLIFPTLEFCAGVGLLVARFRRVAAWMLCVMHVVLIATLGPWGADHSMGVLVWNAVLAGHAYGLFIYRRSPSSGAVSSHAAISSQTASRPIPWAAMLVTIWVVAAPATERWGGWDHWLSWSLYSPHTSRVSIQLHQSALGRLPVELRRYVQADADADRWHRFSIQQWSIDQRRAAVYPQARYQLALARWLALTHKIDSGIRVTYQGISDRWSGARTQRQMIGRRNLWD